MPKRIRCKVVRTTLLCPDRELLVSELYVVPWYFSPPVFTSPSKLFRKDPSVTQKIEGKANKSVADFDRQSRILDYYA